MFSSRLRSLVGLEPLVAVCLLLSVGVTCVTSLAHAFEAPPFASLVNDTANLLSESARERLIHRLDEFRKERGCTLTLLTLNDLQHSDPAEFGAETVAAWHLGEAPGDSSALVLVTRQEKHVHIAVSRGLEDRISNSNLEQILDDIVIPELRAGHFDLGLEGGFNELIFHAGGKRDPEHMRRLLAQRQADAYGKREASRNSPLKRPVMTLLAALFLLWVFVASRRMYLQTRNTRGSSGSTGASSSRSSSSSSSSSFSGGGGSFGGGGASGSW